MRVMSFSKVGFTVYLYSEQFKGSPPSKLHHTQGSFARHSLRLCAARCQLLALKAVGVARFPGVLTF